MFWTILSAAFFASAAQPASGSTILQPSGPWKVDYAENQCVLSRPFSAAGAVHEFHLTFEPVQSRAWLRIGTAEVSRRRDDGEASVEVDGRRLSEPVHFNIFPNAKGGTTREFLFEDFRDQAGGTRQSLRLKPRGYGDLTLAAGNFPEAMRAMDACMLDLHRGLGIDPAVLRTIAVKPEGDASPFVHVPANMDEVAVKLLYWVTPEGMVDECRILVTSGNPDIDAATCDNLKKDARFKPARDSAGKRIRAPVYEHVAVRTSVFTSASRL